VKNSINQLLGKGKKCAKMGAEMRRFCKICKVLGKKSKVFAVLQELIEQDKSIRYSIFIIAIGGECKTYVK
jgi:hypothetical protein